MKLLLLVLIITLNIAFSPSRNLQETLTDDPWRLQDDSAVVLLEEEGSIVNLFPAIRANYLLNDVFNFGLQAVIAMEISRGKLITVPIKTFDVIFVSDWTEDGEKNVSWYTFTAVVKNEDEYLVIETKFTVYYNWVTYEKALVAYTSKITNMTTTPEGVEVFVEENDELTFDFIWNEL